MGLEEHRRHAPEYVTCAVITVSDSKTKETDETGRLLIEGLTAHGHTVLYYEVVPNEVGAIRAAAEVAVPRCDVVITSGGTGLSPKDRTIEALQPLFEKTLDGFGELFRALTYSAIGSAALLTRAAAGAHRGRIIVCLPGAPEASRLALEKLLLPEMGHMVGQVRG